MPIVSTDLELYASANRPEDDTTTTGGAIATTWYLAFTQLAADDDIGVVSDNAGDTQNCTVDARNAAGAIVTETNALTGVTEVQFHSGTVERFLKMSLATPSTGQITVARYPAGANIATLPAGVEGLTILFYDSASDPSATRTRYEKGFWKNNHGTLSLTGANVELTADPSSKINIDLDSTVNATTSAANRLTLPTPLVGVWQGVGTAINVPGDGNLDAGEAIGVWFRQSLGIGDAPVKNSITTQLAGNTV